MLVGNLWAVCGAAALAVLSACTESVASDDSRGSVYVHLAIHSAVIVALSYLLSICAGVPVNIISFDSANGLLGILTSW